MESRRVDDRDLRKQAKFLKRWKDAVWKPWTNEYVKNRTCVARIRHNEKGETFSIRRHNGQKSEINIGTVFVII